MTRDATPYAQMRAVAQASTGADVSQPEAGYFRHRLRGGAVRGGVRIFYGPPLDPITGEELDRGWRWQALFDDEPVLFDEVWPECVGEPITERDYREFVGRRAWAKTNAPASSFANSKRRYDPLSSSEPLPF